ncbi:MAG TPA: hypothetical protein VIJ77_10850 [Candidatus Tumulicola sp.]
MLPTPLRAKPDALFWWMLGGALLAAGLLVRAALYFPLAAFPIDSDGVLAGLCAFRIEGGHYPAFFPGGTRLSAASCYVAAAFFGAIGPGRTGLALTGLTWGALYLAFTLAFLRAVLGRRAACAAFVFAAFPAAAFVTVTYVPWGYGEIVASCAATLWLAALWRGDGRPWQRLGFGIGVGFGIWISLQTLVVAVPAVVWIALARRRTIVRESGLALAGALAGATPFWIGNAGRGFPSFTQNWASRPASSFAQVWANLAWVVTAPLPQLLFYQLAGWWSLSTAIVVGYVLTGAGFIAAVSRNARGRDAPVGARAAGLLVLLVAAAAIGFYAASQAGSVRGWTVRYIAPLYVVIPLLCGIGVSALWQRSRWLAVAAVAAIVVPNLTLYSLPGTAARAVLAARLHADDRLGALLARDRVRMVYGDYFDVYDLNFDTHESVAGVPAIPALDYLDYAGALPASGVRWALLGRDAGRIRAWAGALGVRGTTTAVGDRTLFVAGSPAGGTARLLTALRRASP